MNYKLVKQLKEAGFEPKIIFVCRHKNHWCNADRPDCDLVALNPPSLSELIEACGGFKFKLLNAQAGWCAETQGVMSLNFKTPEEAVARLWLELNGRTYKPVIKGE